MKVCGMGGHACVMEMSLFELGFVMHERLNEAFAAWHSSLEDTRFMAASREQQGMVEQAWRRREWHRSDSERR